MEVDDVPAAAAAADNAAAAAGNRGGAVVVPPLPTGPIVTSGESDNGSDDWSSDGEHHPQYGKKDRSQQTADVLLPPNEQGGHGMSDDLLYDENADDEDEAYVYQNLRSGTYETIQVHRKATSKNRRSGRQQHHESQVQQQQQEHHQNQRGGGGELGGSDPDHAAAAFVASASGGGISRIEQMKVLRPRHSDAVLSCPCCFHIVCMDCQRHEKYSDQFRAMFVMNILVRWDETLVYDDSVQGLVPYNNNINNHDDNNNRNDDPNLADSSIIVPPDYNHNHPNGGDGSSGSGCGHRSSSDSNSNSNNNNTKKDDGPDFYYKVCCSNCETQVAALDMTDEVYHFFGCLAASS